MIYIWQLYIWNYNKREEASSPTVVLKTRRSLRAVHFHPHGAPFLLTAEVDFSFWIHCWTDVFRCLHCTNCNSSLLYRLMI